MLKVTKQAELRLKNDLFELKTKNYSTSEFNIKYSDINKDNFKQTYTIITQITPNKFYQDFTNLTFQVIL
jgi:hypothetical protein